MPSPQSKRVCAAALSLLATVGVLMGQGYETVHSFSFDHGGPSGGLIEEADGKVYGVTSAGGSYGKGSVFVMTPDGIGGYDLDTLHEFAGPDGLEPRGPLVKSNDGLFYGTTVWGGAGGLGALFRIDTLGNFELLHSFAGSDGQNPIARPYLAGDGNFYGTTIAGGANGFGTAYRLDSADTVITLHSFTATEGYPEGGFVQAGDGLLYGPARGDATGFGVLYRMTLAGVVTHLHTFSGSDGANPVWPLLLASDGKLYGVASGSVTAGNVYRIDTAGVFTHLHTLTQAQGASPGGPLIQAADGKLYGTTLYGGAQDLGVIFRISTAGAFQLVHSCTGIEPQSPQGRLLELEPGVFVGPSGSPTGWYGALFRFQMPSTLSVWQEFGGTEGAQPTSQLRQATDGLLYGATTGGGPLSFGTLFRMDLTGAFETLHAFSNSDGAYPASWLVQATDGNLYGTTGYGVNDIGTTFRLGLDGTFTLLGENYGASRNLIQASDGLLYGGVVAGVVQFDLSGEATLVASSPPGEGLNAELVQASNGWFYGTALTPVKSDSFIFRANASGAFERVFTFTGGPEGGRPWAGLLLGSDGNLYGTTTIGGVSQNGTVFRYDPVAEELTTLYSFGSNVSGDATFARGRLVEGPGGALFGISELGGLHYQGAIFRVLPSGEGSVVHSFGGGGDDGLSALDGLTLASDGRFYGMTAAGGQFGGGAIYRIDPAALPSVTGLLPSSGPASGGTAVTLSGGVFLPGASVSLGVTASPDVTVLGDNEIEASTPALEAGTLYHAFVTNPDGGSGSLAKAFLTDFGDVPQGDLFHDSIESLVRAGVTAGCGFGFYCGSQSTSRAQMAVFLLKSKLGESYEPPPATGTVFIDVPADAFAAAWIEDLAARGITVGCGGGRFCPLSFVTRAHMAAFLLRTLLGPDYVPPSAAGIFGDVPVGSFAADYIEDLYGRGISAGCSASPLLYCPTRATTRSQMAAFLVSTFSLP